MARRLGNTQRPYQLPGFPGGINNRKAESKLDPTELREALNVDIESSGRVKRRPGSTVLVSGTHCHSLFAPLGSIYQYAVIDATLQRLDTTNSVVTTLGAAGDGELSYAEFNDEIYYCDNTGAVSGRVELDGSLSHLALPQPALPSITATATGGMRGGQYEITATLVDTASREFGAPPAEFVSVPDGGGISLTNIVFDSRAAYLRVYLSKPDPEEPGLDPSSEDDLMEYYWVDDIAQGTSSSSINGEHQQNYGDLCETLYYDPLPPGHLMTHFKGRIYIASGNTVYYTAPFFTVGDRHTHVYELSGNSPITLMQPVEDGMYLGNENYVVFLHGPDFHDPSTRMTRVHSRGAIQAKGVAPGHIFGFQESAGLGFVALWFDREGLIVGGSEGQTRKITRDRLATPEFYRGALTYVRKSGVDQVIATLRQRATTDFAAASDSMNVRVISNNITL